MVAVQDDGEYQVSSMPFILQVSAPCVCGYTP